MKKQPATEKPGDESAETAQTCPVCGMTREEWNGPGYKKDDEQYCCEEGATGDGCACSN